MSARFVRLNITGFKSFADAASLEILPGLTGIVGPNGCGKSNVAEALRWAMGEANARNLRGGEMDDVIFAGTANRPSRNLAEVALTIERGDGTLPPPYTEQAEISVLRRIERGGGSVYRLNGREARARDVQTLFADMASGARSSAMISQGRVSALVTARPEERRAILEEAAGITGLHARRHEAETRLRAAETNLERAEERRGLLEKQFEALQVQAKQAARYRTVATGVLETEAALLALQQARAEKAERDGEAALTQAQAQLQTAIAAAVGKTTEDRAAQSRIAPLREQEAAAQTRLERARMAIESITAEIARHDAAAQAARQAFEQVQRDLAFAETALRDSEGADERLVAEAARLREEAASFPTQLESARQEAASSAAALVTADEAATQAAQAAAEATARSAATRHLLTQAEMRARRAVDAQSQLRQERERIERDAVPSGQLEAAEAAFATAGQALRDAQAALDGAEAARPLASSAAQTERDGFSRAETAVHRLRAGTSALQDVLATRDNEKWPPMVDRLKVEPGFEAALGSVLGEELGAAADPSASRFWRELPAMSPAPLPGRPLLDVIEAPPHLMRALSAIGVVESDEEGQARQADLLPGQALVSRPGAVWRWDGYTVRAGTPSPATVRLEQRNRLARLKAELAQAESAAGEARARRDAALEQERQAIRREQDARNARKAAEMALDKTRSAAQSLRLRADTVASKLAALRDRAVQVDAEASAATEALTAAQQEAALLPDPAALNAAAQASRTAVNAARAREATASRALEALQRGHAGRQNRLGVIEREREDRRFRQKDLAGRVTDLRARRILAEQEHHRLAAAPANFAREAEAAKAALAEASAQAKDTQASRAAAEQAAQAAALALRDAEHAVFSARETLARAETSREAAREAAAVVAAQVAERAGALPAVPAPTELSAAAEDRTRSRLQRLTRERDEMGPVNLRADIEIAALGEEMATIIREREELETAIAKLRGSIGHLNREGRERLSAVFQTVDRHFQDLFRRMFGGGRAHIALVGSDDPLQAGLEIYAQPPGKKLSALSLLSGGEQALTALSLIFAVFRCNPAPLCVLDEVDAPLDDANVERFCALLRDMGGETGTRFLVVTHHQLTMSRMDRLYGVTMQERGISRLLSVDLSLAADMGAAAAAE